MAVACRRDHHRYLRRPGDPRSLRTVDGRVTTARLTPVLRLVARALLAGVVVFVQQIETSDHLDRSIVIAALTSAGWAAAEYLLPFLNATVGVGKGSTP